MIAAYNDMAKLHDVQGNDVLLIGLDEVDHSGSARDTRPRRRDR